MRISRQSFKSLHPEEIVSRFYGSIYSGDLESVRSLMTEQSYFMTLESLGLKLSFKDLSFKEVLESIDEDAESLQRVEQALSKDLLTRDGLPQIDIERIESNGSERVTVHYKEDGKVKNLYFSKEENGWKINYYAGRKVA